MFNMRVFSARLSPLPTASPWLPLVGFEERTVPHDSQ